MLHTVEQATSLPGLIFTLAVQAPDRPMLGYWRDGAWRSMSRGEFCQQVANFAAGLRAQGIMPGDRVLLVSENRPEFMIADNAIMAIGAVTVPTYVTNTTADHAHVLRDSGARVAIVSTRQLAERVLAAAPLDLLVAMEPPPPAPAETRTLSWAEMTATEGDLAMLIAEVEHIPAGRLACLIYTSGTGGNPKGVMLPHRAMLTNCAGAKGLIDQIGVRHGRYLSFLPLSHSYEHTVGGFLMPACGYQVIFSRGADKLLADFAEHRPHLITTVPRLFEVIRERIMGALEKEGGLRLKLFQRALALGLRKLDGPPLGLFERLQDAVLDRLVREKVRARFGGSLEALVSGGARLDPELSGFFLALGVTIIQGYGQSEAGPVISVNLPWDNDRRSVGKPLPGVEVRLAEDGELLVKGGLVMDGYWNNPDATAQALRIPEGEHEPWLHTGDVAELRDGRIHITDRKRDFIKLKGGDMVAPSKIEAMLAGEAEVAQAVVAGEGMAGVVALIVPAEGQAERVGEAVKRVNARLSNIERIRRFHPLPEAFTVENGLLTPTMKIKRRPVLERYAAEVEALG
ncbi:long-chain fatty acid--CoA ligase [Roseococcus sp. SDR]|uniref:AMP-dependent synthetase/ligase n=1 Tax=Roseococcus sp. SDR TaxID=2835532 RepID=UPI001BD0D49A|nr:long-chain fatty acid--CoA ligase [Roseococcus sp. SDR]MBS7790816.1 long-chain fatty acid--CoA ligase [Roseococcus sp. SDR]MBV1846130.1 long-chain fatty acid--CoA ligase [Roseococcus sp. SDR]